MRGNVIKYGDSISTDAIIAGKYTKTLNFLDLASHAMEDLDPSFPEKVKNRKIIVAGKNFGCGSSREQAPIALMHAGIQCVLAKEFSRIFYRNAINIGLCIAECDTDLIDDDNEISFEIGSQTIQNHTKGINILVSPMPKLLFDILASGGIEKYIRGNNGQLRDENG